MTDETKNESEPPNFLLLLILFALVAIGGLIAIVIHDMGATRRGMEQDRANAIRAAETKEIVDRLERNRKENQIRQNAIYDMDSVEDRYWRTRLNRERQYRERQWRERGY